MGKIALIFDTEEGNTNRVAIMIQREFPEDVVDIYSAGQLEAELIEQYKAIIVGTPTVTDAKLADNWQFFMETDGLPFTGKTVALFGLGDQVGYPGQFVDAIGVLYNRLVELGATVVGEWPTDGYSFTKSRAVKSGKFVGLAIDQDNQSSMTKERVANWVGLIKEPLMTAASS